MFYLKLFDCKKNNQDETGSENIVFTVHIFFVSDVKNVCRIFLDIRECKREKSANLLSFFKARLGVLQIHFSLCAYVFYIQRYNRKNRNS